MALVLSSVLLGAFVVASADHRTSVWAVTSDVSAGTVLTADDLSLVRVRLGSAGDHYLPAGESPTGKETNRALQAGELLPRAAVAATESGVVITLPVSAQNTPAVSPGQRITAWLSTKTCHAQVLLSGASVQDVRREGSSAFGSATGVSLVLRLPPATATRVVAALDLDDVVIRVGVLSADDDPLPMSADPSACGVGSR